MTASLQSPEEEVETVATDAAVRETRCDEDGARRQRVCDRKMGAG